MKYAQSFENINWVSIATTEICNISCAMCFCNRSYSSIPGTKTLAAAQVTKFISGLGGSKEIQFGSVGEPLMDKSIPEYIHYAKKAGHTPVIVTNGQLLSGDIIDELLNAGCKKFSISTDTINADEYAKIRKGGDFNKILAALAYLKQRKSKYPDIITVVRNVLLSEYSEDTMHTYCRFWNGKADFVYWQALVDNNLELENTIYTKPEEEARCECKLDLRLLPSGHICPCWPMTFHSTLGRADWLPHIDNVTPAEAWDYFNESYKTENSPFWEVCQNCKLWPMYCLDKMGNSPNCLQVKLENSAPLPNSVLYKKEADVLKNDLQYNRDSMPHIATPFFASPLTENGQELLLTLKFEKPCTSFTVEVQNAWYDQFAVKTVNSTTNTEIHLTINVFVCCEELRLVFYPASGIIGDFLPVSLELSSNATSREFLRYTQLKAGIEKG